MFRFSLALIASTTLLPSPGACQIQSERVVTGLVQPVYATSAPGDSSRLFVLEQRGVIRVVRNDSLLTRPFLDIQSLVFDGGNEQGLLGLAFHPGYESNGRFFVYFTEGYATGLPDSSTVFEYQVSTDPDSADASTGARVFTVPQPFANHNAGQIDFGPDGYLYVGLGDGGSSNDPQDRAQNGLVLLGKLLRIDVDAGDDYPGDPFNNYAVPAGNPYVGNPNFLPEIWALGLRNPYRWSFDRLTGDLWIADVGQRCFEEVSFQPASSPGGENYGWDIMEGPDCFNEMPNNCTQGPCGTGLVDPVYSYGHTGFRCAITGGYRYRGSIPGIQGQYFFADYCSAEIWSVSFDGAAVTDSTDWTAVLDPPNATIDLITGFGEDARGELYILDRGGEMFRIIADPNSAGTGAIAPPGTLALSPPAPNPFRTRTRLDVRLDRTADVRVAVYTAAGRLVRTLHDGPAPAGVLSLEWEPPGAGAGSLPAGVYFVRAEAGGRVAATRVTLLR